MKLDINVRNLPGSGEIIKYIDYRLSFAFSCIRHEVESISLTLSDVNGPRQGVDKQCRIVIKPMGMKRIVITETREKIQQAIDRALARASQSLSRKVKRRNVLHRRVSFAKVTDPSVLSAT